MKYGICHLSIVPMRLEASDTSEMVNQVLFGEHFQITQERKKWICIRLQHDGYEGWIDVKQFEEISEEEFKRLSRQPKTMLKDLVDIIHNEDGMNQMNIVLGSYLPDYNHQETFINQTKFHLQGEVCAGTKLKSHIVQTAYYYLGSPYLWGGRSPFGIDCSGFTQMVYRLMGMKIPRDASQQALQGEALSFIEESEPGDLAFFDNKEGHITHVGILLSDNYIIHASGKVRLDRLDQSGIFNADLNRHTHKLRVIKKYF